MNWLAINDINHFELTTDELGALYTHCPDHGVFRVITGGRPIKLREIFKAIAEHTDERHKDGQGI